MAGPRIAASAAAALLAAALFWAAPASAQPAPPPSPDRFACSVAPGPPVLRPGANCRRIIVDGFERDYIVTVPRPLPFGPLPLVVSLPDSGASAGLFSRVNGFNGAVDDGEAILVVPHPLPYVVPDRFGDPVWLERWTPAEAVVEATPRPEDYPEGAPWPPDDVAYVMAVIAAVQAETLVDPSRIFVSGLADAGAFAVGLAYAQPDVFAAVGVGVVGLDLGLPPGLPAIGAVPVFAVVGERDPDAAAAFGGTAVPFDPGVVLADPARFATVLDAFGLTPPPCSAAVREDGNLMTIVYCAADGTAGFTFVVVRGLGHAGPNAINNPGRYTFGPEMWRFFDAVAPGG